MANSRKSRSRNNGSDLPEAFERALGDIRARVAVSRPSIAIAYSGGLDSTVLLWLASRYAVAHGLAIHAFHVHHGLSPNADTWLEHCRMQAQRWHIPFEARKVHLRCNTGEGVEQEARIARYAALGHMCRAHDVMLLLTAHHLDDQAETVLLQLMRGAGLAGLCGMHDLAPEHELLGPGVALGRPLLSVSRQQLERTAHDYALQHVSDESNVDVRYRRNAIRHQVVPVLQRHFPGFAQRVARTATHLHSAQSLLSQLAQIDLANCKLPGQGNALDLASIRRLPDERVDNLLRHWLLLQGLRAPSTAQLEEIREQMLKAASDTQPVFDFGDCRVRRNGKLLELAVDAGNPPEQPVLLQWCGEPAIDVPQWNGRLVFEQVEGPGLDPQRLRTMPLLLRMRSGQERLKLANNRPSRTLKNLFQEASIAPSQRKWLPLLYIGPSLVFVAGLGMDVRHVAAMPGILLRWEST